MQITLTIKERTEMLSVMSCLESGMATVIIAREILRKTAITAEEVVLVGMIDTDQGTIWDISKDPKVEFDFSDAEMSVLRAAANSADHRGKININNISLIEKLMK